MNRTLARLTRIAVDPSSASDGHLLDAFQAGRDGVAFEALVRRHGPMVLALCRRLLRHEQDAEDAFQATFLVLARRAADVWPREAVGSWLYGVAYRVALKARATRARRRGRERPIDELVHPAAADLTHSDLADVVGRFVRNLPEVYRAAVVACDLEGRSRKEAAEHLGWKEGTLSGRLARARELLATRLRRAGLVLPAGGVAALLGTGTTADAGPPELVRRVVLHAIGNPAAGLSGPVATLTEGVVRTMFLMKMKTVVAVAVAACAVGFGVWNAAGAGDQAGGTKPTLAAPARPKPATAVAEGNGPVVADLRLLLAGNAGGKQDAAKRAEEGGRRARSASAGNGLDEGEKEPSGEKPLTAQPGPKTDTDIPLLQGRWRVEEIAGGNEVYTPDPQEPLDLEIDGTTLYMPFRDAEGGWRRIGYRIVVDSGKRPKRLDWINANGQVSRGIYEFDHLSGRTITGVNGPVGMQLAISAGTRPATAGTRPTHFEATEGVIRFRLRRRPEDKDTPAAKQKPPVLPGPRIEEARAALDEIRKQIEMLAALKEVNPAELDHLRKRLDVVQSLLGRPETGAAAGEALRPPPAVKDQPDMKGIWGHRVLEQAQAHLESAKADFEQAKAQFAQSQARLEIAKVQLDKATQEVDAAAKATRLPGAADLPSVEVRDDRGTLLEVAPGQARTIASLAEGLVRGSGGEVDAKDETRTFPARKLWERLEKTGHVRVRFSKPRVVKGAGNFCEVVVGEILVPVSKDRTPELVMTRTGTAYRVFFDFPEGEARNIQKLLESPR